MLSDEEKKAIEYLKQNNIVEIQYDNYGLESIHRVGIDEKQTILNLIEKQSKEIEELKFKYQARKDRTKKEIEELKENNKLLQENYSSAHEDINWFCENYISKEESEQRERKAYIKGTNDAHELCNKKWEDKIKARIKEVQQRKENDGECELALHGFQREAKIEVLQSLLEKE